MTAVRCRKFELTPMKNCTYFFARYGKSSGGVFGVSFVVYSKDKTRKKTEKVLVVYTYLRACVFSVVKHFNNSPYDNRFFNINLPHRF